MYPILIDRSIKLIQHGFRYNNRRLAHGKRTLPECPTRDKRFFTTSQFLSILRKLMANMEGALASVFFSSVPTGGSMVY